MGRALKEMQFTREDENLIIRLVKENAEILFSRTHRPLDIAKKKEIWEWIAAELNASTSRVKRSGPEVMQKWQNLVIKARKKGKVVSLDDTAVSELDEMISESDDDDEFDDTEYERKSSLFGQFVFTKAETKLLLARVAEHRNILTSEKWADVKEKRQIWQQITDELNAKNPKVKRTVRQVRRRWINVNKTNPEYHPTKTEIDAIEGAAGDSPIDSQPKSSGLRSTGSAPGKCFPHRGRRPTEEELEREVLREKLAVLKAQKEVWSTATDVLKSLGDGKIQLLINLQPVSIVTEEQQID